MSFNRIKSSLLAQESEATKEIIVLDIKEVKPLSYKPPIVGGYFKYTNKMAETVDDCFRSAESFAGNDSCVGCVCGCGAMICMFAAIGLSPLTLFADCARSTKYACTNNPKPEQAEPEGPGTQRMV